jgi:hypothetical protein
MIQLMSQRAVDFKSGVGVKGETYLAAVDVAVLDSCGHIALARDMDALRVGLDHRRAILLVCLVQDADDVLELIGADLRRGVRQCVSGFKWIGPRGIVDGRRRKGGSDLTVKPSVAAQVLSPAALTITALSMWPEPTRLRNALAHNLVFTDNPHFGRRMW